MYEENEKLDTKETSSCKLMSLCSELLGSQPSQKLGKSLYKAIQCKQKGISMFVHV